jgi:hypothetical protein
MRISCIYYNIKIHVKTNAYRQRDQCYSQERWRRGYDAGAAMPEAGAARAHGAGAARRDGAVARGSGGARAERKEGPDRAL